MAYLFRLIAAVLLIAVSSSSNALVPEQPAYRYGASLMNETSPRSEDWRSTLDAACAQALTHSLQVYASSFSSGVVTACTVGQPDAFGVKYRFTLTPSNGGGTLDRYSPVYQQANGTACPAHSVSVTGGCKCDTGYVEMDGQCKTPGSVCVDKATQPAIPAGVTQEFSTVKPSTTKDMFKPRSVCIDGCQASGTPSYWACGGTQCTSHFEAATFTGAVCSGDGTGQTPASDPVPTPDAQKCPDGKVPGSVNGTSVCTTAGEAGSKSDSSSGTTKSGTNPDGSSAAGSGTSSTSSTTSCDGTNCSTTTTKTTTSGTGAAQTSTQESSTSQQPQRDYCTANPKAKECVGNKDTNSSFSGACAGGFKAVSEDAVINAMAEEIFRQNCKVNPDDASQTLGREESAKTGNQTGNNPNNGNVSIGAGSFDSSNALGGVASCIADKTIVVMGRSVNIAFSMICQYLEALGLVMLGVASLLALRIVTRG